MESVRELVRFAKERLARAPCWPVVVGCISNRGTPGVAIA